MNKLREKPLDKILKKVFQGKISHNGTLRTRLILDGKEIFIAKPKPFKILNPKLRDHLIENFDKFTRHPLNPECFLAIKNHHILPGNTGISRGTIYCIVNNISEKIYIGSVTNGSILDEFSEIFHKAFTSESHNKFFYMIRQILPHNFRIIELDKFYYDNENYLQIVESFYVKYFDSIKNGYNYSSPYNQIMLQSVRTLEECYKMVAAMAKEKPLRGTKAISHKSIEKIFLCPYFHRMIYLEHKFGSPLYDIKNKWLINKILKKNCG